jgi:hypothetical protein
MQRTSWLAAARGELPEAGVADAVALVEVEAQPLGSGPRAEAAPRFGLVASRGGLQVADASRRNAMLVLQSSVPQVD